MADNDFSASSEKRAKAESPALKIGKVGTLAGVSLTATAMAIPLLGFAAPLRESNLQEKTVGAFGVDDSWVGSDSDTQADDQASGLEAVEAAASRAKVRTPLEVPVCVSADTAANGSREIVEAAAIYWPLQEGTYSQTSDFGWRISPVSGEMLLHEGVDWAASAGTPIYAAADGVVTEVDFNSRSGGYVVVEHQTSSGEKYFTAYLHQYSEDIKVSVGQTVSAGEQIGAVGNAGWSTGAHLHFEVRNANGDPIEPTAWMEAQGAVFIGEGCA